MPRTVPSPRLPPDGGVARWYEHELGWATVPAAAVRAGGPGRSGAPPVALRTGLRFDVLELPAPAGEAVLRRMPGDWPVALAGRRMRLWVAAGGADELPGLLDWLEWGGIALDLVALGAGGRTAAPVPPGWAASRAPGAPVWLRPPVPGREVEPALPAPMTLTGPAGGPAGAAPGGGTVAPCLARLVDTAASECHRIRLLGARGNQRLASS
ncbi:SCO3374 family protein [Streptomyces sp. LP05-1]|uniref:SCO3374 family protein n=1 Tax=Streptomyces pyxinae TaxID=2970734 RepID=A0ABT2CQH5_9ACTN|nr:SCO3374 family protein [Streptomyces sp. LP05-1]MCS0639689.1 SCO3374 family protein [Streptomyces sp. LP05-1]